MINSRHISILGKGVVRVDDKGHLSSSERHAYRKVHILVSNLDYPSRFHAVRYIGENDMSPSLGIAANTILFPTSTLRIRRSDSSSCRSRSNPTMIVRYLLELY